MSQISTENEENRSVAASDFVKLDQPDEVADQEQQQQPQFGLHKKPLDYTLDTRSTSNYGNDMKKELKLIITNLEANNQALQAKVEKVELMAQGALDNLELRAENRAQKEKAEQNANIQVLKDEFTKMLFTQNEQHQKQMEQLESKNRKLEEKLSNVELKEQLKLKEKINWNQVDLAMGNKLYNPIGNRFNSAKTRNSISTDGLYATNFSDGLQSVYAEKGFIISVDSPGPVLSYFEITALNKGPFFVGLSSGNIPDVPYVGVRGLVFFAKRQFSMFSREDIPDGSIALGAAGLFPNSYAIQGGHDNCMLSGKSHDFKWPNGAIKPKWNGQGDVAGCGLLLNFKYEVSIFFTLNGILMGKEIPIHSTENPLYPTVTMSGHFSVEANFGDNPAKPFNYDIKKCPGMVFE